MHKIMASQLNTWQRLQKINPHIGTSERLNEAAALESTKIYMFTLCDTEYSFPKCKCYYYKWDKEKAMNYESTFL